MKDLRVLLTTLIAVLALHCAPQSEPAPELTTAPEAEELARATFAGIYDEPVTLEDGLAEMSSEVTGILSIEDIGGPEWVLTHLDWNEPAPAEPEVTLVFEDGRMGGSGGCNRYFTAVAAGETPGDLTLGPIGSTMMACPDEIMALERRYLKAVESTVKFSFLAGKLALTFRDDDSSGVLIFAPRERSGDGAE